MKLHHYIMQLVENSFYKLILSVAFTVITFLKGFYGELMLGLAAFLVIDFITGVWRSISLGQKISSKRLRESVTKAGTYFLLVTTLIVASKIESTFLPFVTIAYYYCIFTEMKSILENLQELGLEIPKAVNDKIESILPTKKKDEGDKDE